MTVQLQLKAEDFESFKAFEKAMKKQLGTNIYVGTNSACLYFDYPPELVERLRPHSPSTQLEFSLNSSHP
jgi:hypothetical protein